MRKFLSLVCLFVLTASYGFAQTDFWSEYLGFRVVSDNTVIVSETDSPPEDVVIPATVVNNDVTYNVIGVSDVFWDKDNIKTVVVSEGVQYLDLNAFGDCQGLSALVLPSTLERIGENAFVNDHALTAISCFGAVPPALHNNAKDGSFWGVSWDQCMIYVPNDAAVDAYKATAWNGFANIMVMNKNFSVDGISYTVLADGATVGVAGADASVTNLNIPETVTNLLRSYTVTAVLKEAFKDNGNLVTATLPKTIKTLDTACFVGAGMTSITFAEGTVIETMGTDVLAWCNKLTSVELPEGIVDLPKSTFANSDAIESITMPSTLLTIKNDALTNCVKLKTLKFTGAAAPTVETDLNGSLWAVNCMDPDFKVIMPYKYRTAYEAELWNTANFTTVQYTFPVSAEVNYATLYDSQELTAEGNATIYTGRIVGNYLVLDQLAGNVIPAGTAVIVAGDFELRHTSTGATFAGTNALKGVDADTDASTLGANGIFVLGKVDGAVGFYKYSGTTLGANKAYVEIPAGAAAKALTITTDENGATGIDTVEVEGADKAVYTIDGIRTEGKSLKKGIYIRNGKKFVVK